MADSQALAERLRAIGHPRTYRKGDFLVRMGDQYRAVLVIDSGKASVRVNSAEGDEMVLAVRGPGSVVGEFSVISNAPAMATVEALEPVEVSAIGAEAYREFLFARPEVMFEQLKRVVEMLRESDSRRLQQATLSLDRRVAAEVELDQPLAPLVEHQHRQGEQQVARLRRRRADSRLRG